MMFNGYRPPAGTGGPPISGPDRSQQFEIEGLEMRLERLSMICQAMWELLQEVSDLTEDELQNKVREIDMRDGKEDGKRQRQLLKCSNCGRTMNPRHRHCLYCGATALTQTVFDEV